jgi:hypothetical protein
MRDSGKFAGSKTKARLVDTLVLVAQAMQPAEQSTSEPWPDIMNISGRLAFLASGPESLALANSYPKPSLHGQVTFNSWSLQVLLLASPANETS